MEFTESIVERQQEAVSPEGFVFPHRYQQILMAHRTIMVQDQIQVFHELVN